jgi:decaprenyl-phosphate phosphoribosyltransferase
MKSIDMAYIRLFRPKQWIKQILILLPLITLVNEISSIVIKHLFLMVVAFSLVTSFIYIVNDIFDSESDKLDSTKNKRPIASGDISAKNAFKIGLVILLVPFTIIYFLPNRAYLYFLVLLYLTINVAYSKFKLKKFNILGMLIVSIGFPIRFVIGSLILQLPFPYWGFTLLSILSLAMIAGKRYQTVKRNKICNKRDLNLNIEEFWILTLVLLCAMFIAIYVGFITSPENQLIWGNTYLLASAIPVSLCLIRYLEIVIHPVNFKLKDATESVLTDFSSIIIVCSYIVIMILGKVTNAA